MKSNRAMKSQSRISFRKRSLFAATFAPIPIEFGASISRECIYPKATPAATVIKRSETPIVMAKVLGLVIKWR